MTFRDLARACYHQLGGWGYSDQTQTRYDRSWMQFLAFVKSRGGADDIRSFNDRNVFEFAEWLGRPVKDVRPAIHPNSIINMLSALSTLARYGMQRRDDSDRRLIREDPTRSFRWPQAQRVETKWAHPDEIRKMVDLAVPTYKAVARDIFVETGIRAGEAARLNIEHFRQDSGRYYLAIKLKGRGQRRRAETRDIPISKGLGDSIRDWILARGDVDKPESALLINSEGLRWKNNSISNMISRLASHAGVTRMRMSAHKLRHSANVRDRVAGLDAYQRAKLRGHSSIRSQERYDHIMPGELHEATERSLDMLQQWLGKPFPPVAENADRERNEQTRIANDGEDIRDREP